MKICKECGEELEEDCLVCPECLHEVVSMEDVIIKEQSQKDSKEEDKRTETSQVDNNSQNEKNANIYGLVGMIVGIVAFLIGWIMILWKCPISSNRLLWLVVCGVFHFCSGEWRPCGLKKPIGSRR